MKYILCFLLLIIFACNSLNKKNAQSNILINTDTNEMRSVFDTVIVKPIISKCILNYMEDTSIVKYKEAIKLLTVEFFHENEDTILSICGHSVLPVIGPQNKLDKYEFKGFLFFNETPVLFYDNEKGFGYEFYDASRLIKDSLKFEENQENRIGFPRWIYKVSNDYNIDLLKKIPEFRLL